MVCVVGACVCGVWCSLLCVCYVVCGLCVVDCGEERRGKHEKKQKKEQKRRKEEATHMMKNSEGKFKKRRKHWGKFKTRTRGPNKSPKTTIFPDAFFFSPWICRRFRPNVLSQTPKKALFHQDAFTDSREQSEMEAAFEKTLDPIAGSPALGKSVAGIIYLFVDDLFGTGGNEMEQRVLTRLGKDFQVGSQGWNDVVFTGLRIRWTQVSQNGPYIEVSQNKAVDELEDPVERKTKEDLRCTTSMHTMYRSLLGQTNWLQSRTQFQCCYKFSRCASMAASPTIGDVTSLNKLARQIQSQPVKLQYWPLTEPLRILGFPDDPYRNNDDGSSMWQNRASDLQGME